MKITYDKEDICKYVSKRIEHVINDRHVKAVINILFEEMVVDLKNAVPIMIKNFGILYLPLAKTECKYWDFRFQELMVGKGSRKLQFSIARRLRKKIRAALDMTCLDA